jgi:glucosyl-3-phosphoglycerate synthase
VVVPARNEEALVASCLRTLAAQTCVEPHEYEVLLVLDHCTDATAKRAMEVAEAHPRINLHFLEGPGLGPGRARRGSMAAASERLMGLGQPKGLIASTDADTVVARDWICAQLIAAGRGA